MTHILFLYHKRTFDDIALRTVTIKAVIVGDNEDELRQLLWAHRQLTGCEGKVTQRRLRK